FLTLRGYFLLALSFFAATFGLYATPFQNGSFESPTLASGTTLELAAGSNEMPGWTVGTGGVVTLVNGPVGGDPPKGVLPVDGAQQIRFIGTNRVPGASISQMFDTKVGQTYAVSFD